jgi:hypothetical protein
LIFEVVPFDEPLCSIRHKISKLLKVPDLSAILSATAFEAGCGTFKFIEYYGYMSENAVLLIEVRNGQLYEAESNKHVARGDLALMITTGRKYKVVDPQTGEDVTRNLGRHIGRCG